MSLEIEEGIKSTDVAKIKTGRGLAKIHVYNRARSAQQSVSELVGDDGNFLLEEYEDDIVKEHYRKLGVAYNQFQGLHERYLKYREKKSDPEDEKLALENEESYAQDVKKNSQNLCGPILF